MSSKPEYYSLTMSEEMCLFCPRPRSIVTSTILDWWNLHVRHPQRSQNERLFFGFVLFQDEILVPV